MFYSSFWEFWVSWNFIILRDIAPLSTLCSVMRLNLNLNLLVEHCTDIAEVIVSNPVKATWIFQVSIYVQGSLLPFLNEGSCTRQIAWILAICICILAILFLSSHSLKGPSANPGNTDHNTDNSVPYSSRAVFVLTSHRVNNSEWLKLSTKMSVLQLLTPTETRKTSSLPMLWEGFINHPHMDTWLRINKRERNCLSYNCSTCPFLSKWIRDERYFFLFS